jgi:hypothetical protein
MVAKEARGLGVAHSGEYALSWAYEQRYAAMPFNADPSTPGIAISSKATSGMEATCGDRRGGDCTNARN